MKYCTGIKSDMKPIFSLQFGRDLSVRFQIGSGKVLTSASRKTSEGSNPGRKKRNASAGKLHPTATNMRKHSAPPRMITGVDGRKQKDIRAKPSSNSLDASQLAPMDPGRKSGQSSTSSMDKNEYLSGATSDPDTDTEQPAMVSSSVSTEDITDVKAGESLVEVRKAVEVKGGNFCWDFDSDQPFLKNISVKIPVGELCSCGLGTSCK